MTKTVISREEMTLPVTPLAHGRISYRELGTVSALAGVLDARPNIVHEQVFDTTAGYEQYMRIRIQSQMTNAQPFEEVVSRSWWKRKKTPCSVELIHNSHPPGSGGGG